MDFLQIAALLLTHAAAAAAAAWACRRGARRDLDTSRRRCSELEAGMAQTLARLRGLRQDIHVVEQRVIRLQLQHELQAEDMAP